MSERLDIALARRGLAASREKAKGAIAAGLVYVNDAPAAKPSMAVEEGDRIEVRGVALRYVGRGGVKLEHALRTFSLDPTGARCVDVGASTGGFTDCLLQHSAAHVTAVDVGHGQLDAGLAADPRVTSLEGTDARTLTPESLGGAFDAGVADVSFISLAHVLPALSGLVRPGGWVVCLVKPQFEAGPAHIGKHGLVRDPRVHREVLGRVLGVARAAGLDPAGLTHSPVTGGDGNVEYLLHARRRDPGAPAGRPADLDVAAVVAAARAALAPR